MTTMTTMTGSTLSPAPATLPSVVNVPVSTPVSLPAAIPDPWLAQIREAVKSDRSSLVLTLLGSSVLAALIAAATAIGTAVMTIRASGSIEIQKSQIAERRAEADAARASYEKLETNLGTLLTQFRGVATLIDIARDRNALSTPGTAENLRAKLNAIGQTEGAILALKTDARLDNTVWSQIDGLLNRITAAIVDTDPSFRNLSQAADSIEADLTQAISSVHTARSQVAAGH